MKKLVILFLMLLSNQAFGQKLNYAGQKMVSSVHIHDFFSNEHIDIFYNYNECGYLKKVVRNVKVDNIIYKDVITRDKHDKINRLCYKNGLLVKNYQYKYDINSSGFVNSKCELYNIGNDSIMKISCYVYDKHNYLRQINKIQYVKNNTEWSPAHDVYYINFVCDNGNLFWDKMHSNNFNINNKREYYENSIVITPNKYGNIKNDTNINLNLFFSMICWEICLDVHEFELSTEWYGMKSDLILEYEKGFKISTIIKNGNVVEMNTLYKNGNIFRKMEIKYLY